VLLTTHPLLVPRSWKRRATFLPTIWVTTGPVRGTPPFLNDVRVWNLGCLTLPVCTNAYKIRMGRQGMYTEYEWSFCYHLSKHFVAKEQ